MSSIFYTIDSPGGVFVWGNPTEGNGPIAYVTQDKRLAEMEISRITDGTRATTEEIPDIVVWLEMLMKEKFTHVHEDIGVFLSNQNHPIESWLLLHRAKRR